MKSYSNRYHSFHIRHPDSHASDDGVQPTDAAARRSRYRPVVIDRLDLQEDGPNMWPWTCWQVAIISFRFRTAIHGSLCPGYLLVTGIARLTQRRIWQSPLLAMLLVTLVGTLVYHLISMAALFLNGGIHSIRASLEPGHPAQPAASTCCWPSRYMQSFTASRISCIPSTSIMNTLHPKFQLPENWRGP